MRDGLVRIPALANAAQAMAMPAVALTDQDNLFAVVKFTRKVLAAGVKPIIGADITLATDQADGKTVVATLLCQNPTGYRNLIQIISMAYLEGQASGEPVVAWDWLVNHAEGLIVLSGAGYGDVGLAIEHGNVDIAEQLLQRWQATFPGRYYIELQRTGREGEEHYINHVLPLAAKYQLPVVATNDVRFITEDDFEAHEARVCIHDSDLLANPKRKRRYSEQQYLKSAAEMRELFADIPSALENTVLIAARCSMQLELGHTSLPDFPIPDGFTIESYFSEKAKEGLQQRLEQLYPGEVEAKRAPYDERLQLELNVIINMGFSGYFLIVADFIRWSKNNSIPVGPGRGSGAGSLVAYALMITDLDPLEYELLFERFLNPERVSMPDFDVDFCMEGRDRVIEYVADKYGHEKVSQIITYGSMAAKAVVRDVGRVMGYPYGFCDKLAKLIPFELGITLDKALVQEEALQERYDNEDEVRELIDLARKLEGVTRNAGKHAGGVVIAPSKLTDFTAIYCEPSGDHPVTQFDKDDVEAIGLVKFDFLGLRTLTIIDWAVQAINVKREALGEERLDISKIPTDDAKTFELLQACATTAVFQLESRGMKELIKRLQPDCFEDIIALVALFRPGPLQSGMVEDFIDRKHGRAKVEYPHPDLAPILQPTYGIILYQEQVMQIAQVLASYTLGGADLLRRAMGKKKPEEMAKQRQIFLDGAIARGVDKNVAGYIFDLMEKFAGYGFNKSHSAAYALVAYQTGWLKAHYPAEFMAAVLSSDMDNTDKVVVFFDECQQQGLEIRPPHINYSQYKFTVDAEGRVVYGLGAVKGVGEAAIQALVAEREANGQFEDLFEFCQRVDLRKCNRRSIEALIRAGAMDELGPHRACLLASLERALLAAEQAAENHASGQNDMFGVAETQHAVSPRFVDCAKWSSAMRLQGEKESLGLYLSGHPISDYHDELQNIITARIVDLQPASHASVTVAGLISSVKTMNTKRGDRIAFVTLDDGTGRVDIALFSEAYQNYREYLVKDKLVVVEGDVSVDDYTGGYRISCQQLYDLEAMRIARARGLLLDCREIELKPELITHLHQYLQPHRPGRCPVAIQYAGNGVEARLRLGDEWRVRPTNSLLENLQELFGKQVVSIKY